MIANACQPPLGVLRASAISDIPIRSSFTSSIVSIADSLSMVLDLFFVIMKTS